MTQHSGLWTHNEDCILSSYSRIKIERENGIASMRCGTQVGWERDDEPRSGMRLSWADPAPLGFAHCARTICGTRESPGRTMLRVVSGCNALMELVGADGIEPPTFAL
jgi:hypothetical protein